MDVSETWWGAVVKFARTHARCRARRLPRWTPHTADDLEHEGLIGAVIGMRKWSVSDRRLSAVEWACSHARYAIKGVLRRFNQVVRVPSNKWRTGHGRMCLMEVLDHEPVCDPDLPTDPADEPRVVVEQILGRLGGPDAAVLRAVFLDGRKQRDVAAEIGLTKSAVGWRVKTACERARSLL